MAQRRTKIIATLGPACDKPQVLESMIVQGVNLVRINLSHGSHDEHKKRIAATREIADRLQKTVGILLDLQGPKIRVSKFKEGAVDLVAGQSFYLDATLPVTEGTLYEVGIDYPELPRDVAPQDILLLDDGRIILEVVGINHARIQCLVIIGGVLSNNKGINRQGGGLTAKALTAKDKEDILFAATVNADYVAVSFPRSGSDLQEARHLLQEAGSNAGIIAKIERVEAVQGMDDIIINSDAVMVARGDLGVELGYAELPGVQKTIIHRARALNKAVITATQMMESMISNLMPTRAEVSDVANAVLDGTDAVMLSAETATGLYPVEVVTAMADICIAAERQRLMQISKHRVNSRFTRIDEAIAMAAMYMANHIDTKAIIAFTESGLTPLWMSRIRSGIPIYGLSRNLQACGRMSLYRGVYGFAFDVLQYKNEDIMVIAIETLLQKNLLQKGDRVIVTRGDILGNSGGANALKMVVV